ncbi:exonuclease [Microbacterium phage Hendrix]|uniref:PD-(D/E)XK endonuclease-like domain-containing protein n=1 Tax=Microbacterium phage Hendrix TaxID=2182341 RepID=A0A2U8UUF0_9CAUD|nr:exonuclease [Microbacterium phage Hendrix]AWN07790.1 hypothetical protein PBI_HENDRIX_119 [Microbacterium phage Hendrix]
MIHDETDYFDYDGEKVQAHYSSLTMHRKCPEAWFFRYNLGLRQRPSGGPMTYMHAGSWWGALRAADIYERGRQIGSLLTGAAFGRPFGATDTYSDDGTPVPKFDPASVTRKDVLMAAMVWWKRLPQEHKDDFIEKIGKPLVPHLIYTFEQWRDRFGAETKTERPLGAEVFWKRRLPRPEGDAAWAGNEELPEMWLLGYVDEVYEDTERGLIVVRDHKFNKNIGVHTVIDDMMDSQLELYGWGMGPALQAAGVDQVRAVAYDRAKSVAPKPPTLTTAGRLASRGGEPSVNSSDLRTYLEWANGPEGNGIEWRGAAIPMNKAEKEDPSLGRRYKEGGVYTPEPAIIDKLSSEAQRAQWFQRKLIPLNTNVVKAHLRAAIDSATDIWRTTKRAELTGGASRNLSNANCQWCDFQAICQARMRGGNQGVYDLVDYGLVSKRGEVLAGGKILELANS